MVFRNERAEKTKKKKTKSKSRILKETVSGKARARNLAQIASRNLQLCVNVRSNSEPSTQPPPAPPPPQAFRASFPQKTGNSAKVKRPKKAKLVTNVVFVHPQFFSRFLLFSNPAPTRPDRHFCFELCFRRNHAKNAN